MEEVKNFLESSTIHGLSYISTTKKLVRIFWILVVITGLTGATIIIYESFQNWAESPVTTTLETRPIAEIKFPKVTVCPPRNTYTDLNYDIMMNENITLDSDLRSDLSSYAVEILQEHLHDLVKKNMKTLKDNDRYFNWYHGYTQLNPGRKYKYGNKDFRSLHYINTHAISGSISTQDFGCKFDADKVVTPYIKHSVDVTAPDSIRYDYDSNATLHFVIEIVPIKNLAIGRERFYVDGDLVEPKDTTIIHKNFTYLRYSIEFELKREVSVKDIIPTKDDLVPGFNITWYYSGRDDLTPYAYFYHYHDRNKAFTRKGSCAS